MTTIRLAKTPLIGRDYLHEFEYAGAHFIYLIHSTRSAEIDHLTAFVLRQVLEGGEKASEGDLVLSCGDYPEASVEGAYEALTSELPELIEEEKACQRQIGRELLDFSRAAGDLDSFRRWRASLDRYYFLYLTQRCNMACRYCSARDGLVGNGVSPELDRDGIDRALRFIFADGGPVIRLILFGGEPLLMRRELLKHLLDESERHSRATGKRVRYILDTNGTVWDEGVRSLFEGLDVKIMVSVDGSRRQHDAYRVFADGSPTHEIVERNARAMVEAMPDRVGGRAVLAEPGFDLLETYEFMRSVGFEEIQVLYHTCTGLVGGNCKVMQPIETVSQYRRQMDRLVEDTLARLDRGEPSLIHTDLAELTCRLHRGDHELYRCLMGSTQVVVMADGSLYPCTEVRGPEYRIGHVDGGIDRWDLLMEYAGFVVQNQRTCRGCWLRYSCGGCCYALSALCRGRPDEAVELSCKRHEHDVKAMSYLLSRMNKMDPALIEDTAGYLGVR